MQQITMCDDVEIDVETGEDWKIECDWEDVPTDSENLAWKAAGVFYREIGKDPQGITIRITKRIPMGAGLAGGSADAAAVLRALNRHEGEPFTVWELSRLSAKIGSDVPFCVLGGTALAKGRGEKLAQLLPMPQCFYCVAKPEFSVSTPKLYAAWDEVENPYHPDNNGMGRALDQQNLMHVAGYLGNGFEPLVSAEHPEIEEIKQIMADCGRPLTAANRTRIFMLQFLLHDDPPSCPHHSIAWPFCQSGWMIGVNYTANSLVAKYQKNFFHFMEAIALQGNIYVL